MNIHVSTSYTELSDAECTFERYTAFLFAAGTGHMLIYTP
jgi:hypothetical protein